MVKGSLLFSVPAELTASLVDEIKSSFRARIRDTINDGVDKVIIDVSKLEEVGEDSVELVGDFAEEIEAMGNPFDIAFISQGEDSDMWKNPTDVGSEVSIPWRMRYRGNLSDLRLSLVPFEPCLCS